MLGTGSSASGKPRFPLRLLRLLQPDQEAAKPWALLKGLLLTPLSCRGGGDASPPAAAAASLRGQTEPRFSLVAALTTGFCALGVCVSLFLPVRSRQAKAWLPCAARRGLQPPEGEAGASPEHPAPGLLVRHNKGQQK